LIGATLGVVIVGLGLSTEENISGVKFKTAKGLTMLCPPISDKDANNITMRVFDHCDPGEFDKELFMVEIFGTTIFVSLILLIKFGTKSNEGILGALAVSLALYGMIHLSLELSGGCLNPALALVQSIFQSIMYGKVKDPHRSFYSNHNEGEGDLPYIVTHDSLPIYLIGSIIGGILAGIFGAINQCS
jgi:glycerol uptake facilitator-like aquaporin